MTPPPSPPPFLPPSPTPPSFLTLASHIFPSASPCISSSPPVPVSYLPSIPVTLSSIPSRLPLSSIFSFLPPSFPCLPPSPILLPLHLSHPLPRPLLISPSPSSRPHAFGHLPHTPTFFPLPLPSSPPPLPLPRTSSVFRGATFWGGTVQG